MDYKQPEFIMAGRETQFERLHLSLADALNGTPQVILMSGSAGDGKTWLIREFCRQAQEAHKDLVVACGECSNLTGQGIPYLPFAEIFALLTDAEGVPASRLINDENRNRLKALARQGEDVILKIVPEIISIFAPWYGLLAKGLSYSSERLKARLKDSGNATQRDDFKPEQIFEQFSRLLIELAAKAPLVLVLEDLHWTDEGTPNLFFYLTRRLRDYKQAPILLIGSYRPDEIYHGREGGRHPLEKVINEVKRYWGNVGVEMGDAIGNAAGRAFVDGVLDMEPNCLDQSFRIKLFNHTEGQPLFVVELLRLLQDRESLTLDAEGRWAISHPVTFANLPDKVEAVIRERVQRLKSELKEILTCGCVEGEYFTAEMIARVRQIRERELATQLEEGLGKQARFVRYAGEIRLQQQLLHTFSFQHAVFRQYLYGELSEWQKRLLHRDVGEALEALYGTEANRIAPQLARHFSEAAEMSKAFSYFLQAGKLAENAYSYADALDHYRRAEEIAVTISDREKIAEIRILQAKTFVLVSDYTHAKQAAIKVVESSAVSDQVSIASARVVLGEACRFLGEHYRALEYLQEALRFYRGNDDQNGIAECLRQIVFVHTNRNEYLDAMESAQEALDLFRRIGNRLGENQTLRCIGDLHFHLGDYEQALSDYKEVLRIRREIGQRSREGGALGDIGDVYLYLGFYGESLDLHEQSLIINLEVGYRYGQTWCHHDMGLIHYNLGNLSLARKELDQSLTLAVEIEAPDMVVRNKNDLSLVHRESGEVADWEIALNLAREAAQLAEQYGFVFGQIVGASYEAMSHLKLGDLPAARECSQKAVYILEECKVAEVIEEEIFFNHAQILEKASDKVMARYYLGKAHAEIMRKAEKIKDQAMRESFLTNVRINRTIITAWQTGIETPSVG